MLVFIPVFKCTVVIIIIVILVPRLPHYLSNVNQAISWIYSLLLGAAIFSFTKPGCICLWCDCTINAKRVDNVLEWKSPTRTISFSPVIILLVLVAHMVQRFEAFFVLIVCVMCAAVMFMWQLHGAASNAWQVCPADLGEAVLSHRSFALPLVSQSCFWSGEFWLDLNAGAAPKPAVLKYLFRNRLHAPTVDGHGGAQVEVICWCYSWTWKEQWTPVCTYVTEGKDCWIRLHASCVLWKTAPCTVG